MSQHHDPVHPDSEHLTAEVLADLDLGLLDSASAEHARHHLSTCRQCTQLHDDLAELTQSMGSLGSLGDSGTGSDVDPMPDNVWQRLESVLAAEPVLTPEGAATVVPMTPERKRRFGRPGIGVVAAIAGVALVGAIAIPILNSGGDDAGVGTASGDSSNRESANAPAADLDPYEATRSGTKYDEETLDAQVTELVAKRTALTDSYSGDDESVASELQSDGDVGSPSPSVSPTSTGDPVSGNGVNLAKAGALARSPAAAQECLEGYLGASGVTPLAIDIGLWEGERAAVIVLPKDDPTLAEVWVINPSCSTANAQDPLIYFATITR